MGACEFEVTVKAKTANEAFDSAVQRAQWESGHGGYSGTIAEKHGFKLIAVVETLKEAREMAVKLMDANDSRVADKWGPAGCIAVPSSETFVFFGWASS